MTKALYVTSLLSLLAAGSAHAQITPENRYPFLVEPGKLSTGDVKYAGYVAASPTSGQVRIYNLNHSIYRQVAITIPSGATVNSVQFLSDHLFNTNANLEFVVNLANASPTVYDGMRIFDESGTLLLATDTVAYPTIYNTASGTKMLVQNFDRKVSRVFSLGGTLTPLRTVPRQSGDEQAQAFPNPATTEIHLPYEVLPGQIAELVVRDVAGRQVASYKVDHAFKSLSLDTQTLRPGVYFYSVGTAPAQRFVVQ